VIIIRKILINTYLLNQNTKEKTSYKHIHGFNDHNNGIITYKELDLESTNVTIKYQKDIIEMIRENEKMHMQLSFDLNDQTKGVIHIKELNANIDIYINTKKISITKNNIFINYDLKLGNDNLSPYELAIDFEEV
jgi:uncharacterized beta-barrel protein YwiB (DUF1934 family)